MLELLPTPTTWIFSAWLAQILLLIKVSDLPLIKSNRYASQLKQHKHNTAATHTHILDFSIFHSSELKRLLDPNPSVGHIYNYILQQLKPYHESSQFHRSIEIQKTWNELAVSVGSLKL
jgi:hypothetical protein